MALPDDLPTATGAAGPSCPVAPASLDGRAARLAAFLSALLAALGAARGWSLLLLALAADFALRALGQGAYSPVARSAGLLRRLLRVPGLRVNAGPKRFAATVGAVLCLGAGLALASGHRPLGLGLAAVLGFCASLEAFLGFCLACQLHPWLARVRTPA